MKVFLRLLQFSKPYHHYIPEYVVYILLFVIFGLLNFTFLIPLLDVLFDQGDYAVAATLPPFELSKDYFKEAFHYWASVFITRHGKPGVLVFVSLLLLACALLKNLFGYLSQRVLTRMRVNLVKRLRELVFQTYSTQSLQFFSSRKKGDLLSVISNDVVEVENTVVSAIQVIFREPLQLIATFGLLFYLSPQLTLFTLVFFPVSGFLISALSRRLRKRGNYSQSLLGHLLNSADEAISGIRIVKAFNAEGFVQRKFEEENNAMRKATKGIMNQRELASPISEVLGIAVIVVIIIYGGNLVLGGSGALDASEFIGYLALYFQIITPAKNIAAAISYLQRGLASGERIFALLDAPQAIAEAPNPVPIHGFNEAIEFKNVSFRYGEHAVLKNINLRIAKGKKVALVGESGAGKSTLADLVPRFHDATEGCVTIDGTDVRQIRFTDLRSLMAIVSQEPILFNDTIFNNIAFGTPGATEAAVVAAAKTANAHAFITAMGQGYNTPIGDRGSKLSGGQRQRLTIARAVLKNPEILILDEATSALDTESERLVQEAINNMMEHRTSIVIAHRLSTIRHADEIVVLQRGEMVERGSHEALLAKGGYYARLVQLQEGAPPPAPLQQVGAGSQG